MTYIFPFKGLHPNQENVAEIIAPPYDVVTREEAKALARNKPNDFLHISHAEIDLLDSIDEHDEIVYQKASENFEKLIQSHVLEQDLNDAFYIYQMQQGEHQQTGVLAKANCSAYAEGKIRRHELTRPDKVLDRSKHIESLKAQVSPTLLAHKKDPQLKSLLATATKEPPMLEASLQNVIHRIWRIDSPSIVHELSTLLNAHETIYIADGHHRNEAAYQVSLKNPQYGDSLVAIFPEDELKILGYHRIIKQLPMTQDDFIVALQKDFKIEKTTLAYPKQKGDIILYIKNQAYVLKTNDDKKLDVDILTEKILTPILHITDIRQDKNIAFIGGQNALSQIQSAVDKGQYAAAFLMYPTSMQELLTVADAHQIMPPKSTWFEPKLADGLVSYRFY